MIQFDSLNPYYKYPFGSIESGSALTLRIAAGSGKSESAAVNESAAITTAAVSARLILINDETGSAVTVNGMPVYQAEGAAEKPIYEFNMQIDEAGLYFYHFEVLWQDGAAERTPDHQLTVCLQGYTTPRWLKSGVMYQIFPDRFARSESYRAPLQNKNYILREDWDGTPSHGPDEKGVVRNNDFFGGNLRGIIEKLGYLEDLGITVIYLNPIFEAYSNHRYDTADFRNIDPMLGTGEDFRELCQKATEKGIRIILDGVFNHTGSDSLYFNKNGRFPGVGAYQSKDSPYYKWYRFTSFPDRYESWWGIDTLPGVNETEPSYMDFIVRSEDSVIKHWLRCGVSGYRLDVADELPDEFIEELRAAVKEIRPDGAVIGEVWEDASNKVSYGRRRKYFGGKQLDSVMNYPLKNAVIDFLVHSGDGAELARVVNSIWENYPQPAFSALMNILGTHDTERILTVLGENSRDDDEARQRLFLAMLIVSFMPGIPCVYYGDEIGMKGGSDPFNRMCFDPGRGDPAILRFYRRLFAFRRKIDGLEDYSFQPRFAEGNFYSFVRACKYGRLVVAANSGGGGGSSCDNGGGCLLNLKMAENEYLKDFFIGGSVSYETQGVFRIGENSGIAAWVAFTSNH